MFSSTYRRSITQLCSILFQKIQLAGSLPQQITAQFLEKTSRTEKQCEMRHPLTPQNRHLSGINALARSDPKKGTLTLKKGPCIASGVALVDVVAELVVTESAITPTPPALSNASGRILVP